MLLVKTINKFLTLNENDSHTLRQLTFTHSKVARLATLLSCTRIRNHTLTLRLNNEQLDVLIWDERGCGRGQDASRGGDQLIVDVVLVGGRRWRWEQTSLLVLSKMAPLKVVVLMARMMVVGVVMLVRNRRQGRRGVSWQVGARDRNRQGGRRDGG